MLPQYVAAAYKEHLIECDLWDLELLPAVSRSDAPSTSPSTPLRVGSRVLARRFGYVAGLQPAVVIAAHYDISYTLVYEPDGGVDVGVLHRDVALVDDSEADPCGVRDIVTLTLQKLERAVVVEAFRGGRYRVIILGDPTRRVMALKLSQIVHVAPVLRDALGSPPAIVESFRAIDQSQMGFAKWKNVRDLILHSESYGLPLSFQQVGELQRELLVRTGRIEPQLACTVPVQEEEMLLNFREFEYTVTRAQNLM